MRPALHLAGVTHAALAPLDLAVAPGELVALVGPSGAGKSIALRIAAGFEAPTAGRVWIAGRDVTRAAPSQRDLAVVFPAQPLFAHLSIAENVAFSLRVQRIDEAEIAARVAAAARDLAIEHLLARAPRHLSGGERQRVAIARAVARAPRVMLLDEPLSNLDREARLEVASDLAVILRRAGAAALYVTHDLTEAALLADRILVLRRGAVCEVVGRDAWNSPSHQAR